MEILFVSIKSNSGPYPLQMRNRQLNSNNSPPAAEVESITGVNLFNDVRFLCGYFGEINLIVFKHIIWKDSLRLRCQMLIICCNL